MMVASRPPHDGTSFCRTVVAVAANVTGEVAMTGTAAAKTSEHFPMKTS
jgi:hypothetical protein